MGFHHMASSFHFIDESEERLSMCCSSHHDHRFHYDDYDHMGICNHCKEHTHFYTEEEANELYAD